jgi:ATP-dependent protease ClpP protease subunit
MAGLQSQHPGGVYIGFNWGIDRPTSARLVELISYAHADGHERVNLMISSSGGTLIDAHYAVECISAIPIKLVTWNMSAVQSAANMLFALGVERYATPGSWFSFHQTGFEGVAGIRNSEKEIRDQLKQIELGDLRSAVLIAERSGVDVEVVSRLHREAVTLSAMDAVTVGLAHEIRRPVIPRDALMRQCLPNYS